MNNAFVKNTQRVAVYGSLKRGLYNHHFLKAAEFESSGVTLPHYTMISLGDYPGLLAGGVTAIGVEIYRVNPWTLSRLDKLEEVPRVYRRATVTLPDGSDTFLYLLNERYLKPLGNVRGKVIASGVW